MKRLQRPAAPPRLDRSDPTRLARIREWYAADPRDHWNDREQGVAPVPKALRGMSNERCAWCERALDDNFKVEHYLPRKYFPWLAFQWENLLPACGRCNAAKHTWCPAPLKARPLIDPALVDQREGEVYDPAAVLPSIEDRLLEPSIDDPPEHLRFQPSDCTWKPLTAAGKRTALRFFADDTYNEHIQKVSALARDHALGEMSEQAVAHILELIGHETLFTTLTEYWRSFVAPASAPEASG